MNRHVCVFEWVSCCVCERRIGGWVGRRGAAARLQIDLTFVTLMAFVFSARPKNQGQLSLFNSHMHTHFTS